LIYTGGYEAPNRKTVNTESQTASEEAVLTYFTATDMFLHVSGETQENKKLF
jgi:hypothetical protein